jgi:hypothetical protein
MPIPYLACMVVAASFYDLPPRVLPVIHAVEGGRLGDVLHNANGTDDLGVMQVNTVWLQPLSRASRLTPAEVARRLVVDPCFNIAAAALVMRVYLDETHGDLMRAIGNYHSHTPVLNESYQALVIRTASHMFPPLGPRR